MTACPKPPPPPDELCELYEEIIEGTYDCMDRIVLNAWFPLGREGGGMRHWWRQLNGTDENLDTEHLMRMAGRFSRRLRACAKAHGIPVQDCAPDEEKWKIAQEYLSSHPVERGLFLVLVSRAPGAVWELRKRDPEGKGKLVRKWPYVNHYSFHILDPEWGHIIIKMSGHPPFSAQVILNGHEYVATQGKKRGLQFGKEGNCFVEVSNATALAEVADALCSENAAGLLKQVCERWIYTTCLCFGLKTEEQQRSGFRYEYTTYQGEYSRNYRFSTGRRMEQVVQSLIERTREPLGLNQLKTVFGHKKRPSRKKLSQDRYQIVVETPEYGVTVFKVHYGKLTLKLYTKGERILRIEIVVHNTKELGAVRRLDRFPRIVRQLKQILARFTQVLRCMDASFIADDLWERLPEAGLVGKTKVGGLDINKLRTRRLMQATLALAASPGGFTVRELAEKRAEVAAPEEGEYGPRQAAYDLKKLRAKGLVERVEKSYRYTVTRDGIRGMTALTVLRDKVIRPLLANACQRKRGARPRNQSPIDRCYDQLQMGMQGLFEHLGLAA